MRGGKCYYIVNNDDEVENVFALTQYGCGGSRS